LNDAVGFVDPVSPLNATTAVPDVSGREASVEINGFPYQDGSEIDGLFRVDKA
jgi:hypothetical protein